MCKSFDLFGLSLVWWTSVFDVPLIISMPLLSLSCKSLSFLFIVNMLCRRSVCPNVSFYSSSSSLMFEPKFRFCLDRRAIVSTSFKFNLLSSIDSISSTTLELKRFSLRYLRCFVLPGGVKSSFTLCLPSELPRASKLQSIPLSRLGSIWNCCLFIGFGFSSVLRGGVFAGYLSVIFLTCMQGSSTWYCGSIRIREVLS